MRNNISSFTLGLALAALFAGGASCIPSSNSYQPQSQYYAQPSHNTWQQRTPNNQSTQYYGQQTQYNNRQYNSQPSQQYNNQQSQYNNRQPVQYNNQASQYNSQPQYNTQAPLNNYGQPQYNTQKPQAKAQPSVGVGGSAILAMLGEDNSAASGFMMGNIKGKSPVKLTAEEKELLEDNCASCHDLNRVYWKRGTRAIWETTLAKEHHEENGWEEEDLDPLYKIFRNFPVNPPWMTASDKDYLVKQCTVCHTINRVFWNRGPEEMWKSILSQDQHKEAKIKTEIKKEVFSILKQYMNKEENQS